MENTKIFLGLAKVNKKRVIDLCADAIEEIQKKYAKDQKNWVRSHVRTQYKKWKFFWRFLGYGRPKVQEAKKLAKQALNDPEYDIFGSQKSWLYFKYDSYVKRLSYLLELSAAAEDNHVWLSDDAMRLLGKYVAHRKILK